MMFCTYCCSDEVHGEVIEVVFLSLPQSLMRKKYHTTEAEFKIGVWCIWNEKVSAAVVIQKSLEMLIEIDLIWLFDYFLGRILNNIFLYGYVMWVVCFLPFPLV